MLKTVLPSIAKGAVISTCNPRIKRGILPTELGFNSSRLNAFLLDFADRRIISSISPNAALPILFDGLRLSRAASRLNCRLIDAGGSNIFLTRHIVSRHGSPRAIALNDARLC